MKSVTQPWRDPAFYGFLLFGFALLCCSFACLGQARTEKVAASVRPQSMARIASPSVFSPGVVTATPAPAAPQLSDVDPVVAARIKF